MELKNHMYIVMKILTKLIEHVWEHSGMEGGGKPRQ